MPVAADSSSACRCVARLWGSEVCSDEHLLERVQLWRVDPLARPWATPGPRTRATAWPVPSPVGAFVRRSFEQSQHVALACLDFKLVGMARVLSDGVCNAYLLDVGTQSAVRRRGVATAMVSHLVRSVPGQHVGLQTDAAEQFYASLGFHRQPQFLCLIAGGWLDNASKPMTPPHAERPFYPRLGTLRTRSAAMSGCMGTVAQSRNDAGIQRARHARVERARATFWRVKALGAGSRGHPQGGRRGVGS